MTTLASLHRVKTVVLEYSPRDKRVYVRAVIDGEPTGRNPFSPVHEDNRLEYVRVTEGTDMMQNACAWVFGELVPEFYVATRLNPPEGEICSKCGQRTYLTVCSPCAFEDVQG